MQVELTLAANLVSSALGAALVRAAAQAIVGPPACGGCGGGVGAIQGCARGLGLVAVDSGWDDLPAVTDGSVDAWFDMTALSAAGSMSMT